MATKKVPFGATCLSADVSIAKDKKENKSAKVSLLARTGDSIDHWYWGRIVHDLSGMRLHKNRITLDWNHNPDQLVGYANKFDHSTGDLVVSGAITPTREDDMAAQIIQWAEVEIPLEASISFADDMTIEVFGPDEKATVNDREFVGPITVVRDWGLRSIAVCPWGADKNTSTNLFNSENSEVSVRVIERGVTEMKKDAEGVEPVEAVVELAVGDVVVEDAPVEEAPVEAPADPETEEEVVEEEEEKTPEVVAVVEAVDAIVEAVVEVQAAVENLSEDRLLFKTFVNEFGAELAATYFSEGKDMEQAKDSYLEFLKQENAILKARSSQSLGEDTPISAGEVAQLAAEKEMITKGLLAGLTEGQAQYAAQLKIKK